MSDLFRLAIYNCPLNLPILSNFQIEVKSEQKHGYWASFLIKTPRSSKNRDINGELKELNKNKDILECLIY